MARRIHAVDPREGLDRLVLAGAFFVGAIGTIALKFAPVPLVATAAFPAVVLITYVAGCFLSSQLAIEPETVGDNCYYFGFLFTLVSLAAALFLIGDADFSSSQSGMLIPSIISSFGIALSSTIVGVFLRIFLMQMRPDIVSRDREARRDLSQGVRDFRVALAGVSRDLKSVSIEMAQHAAEREAKTTEIIDRLATSATELIDRQAEGFDSHMRDFSNHLLAELSKNVAENTVSAVATLRQSADQLANALRETSEAHETKVETIREANEAVASAAVEFKKAMSEHHRVALGSYRTLEGRAEKISDALNSTRASLEASAGLIDEATRRQQDVLGSRTEEVTQRLGSVSEALAGVADRLSAFDLEAILREAVRASVETVTAQTPPAAGGLEERPEEETDLPAEAPSTSEAPSEEGAPSLQAADQHVRTNVLRADDRQEEPAVVRPSWRPWG